MKDFKISPDDPRLTAYALGELEGDERAEVEAALRHVPAARRLVEEIRATATQIETALAAETEADRNLAVLPGPDDAAAKRRAAAWRTALRYPQLYYVVGGLAAACFAIYAALRPPRAPLDVRVSPTETQLAKAELPTTDTLPAAAADIAPAKEPQEHTTTLATATGAAAPDRAPPLTEITLEADEPREKTSLPRPEVRITQADPITAPPPVAFAPELTAVHSVPADAAPSAPVAPAMRGLATEHVATTETATLSNDEVVTLSPYEISVDRASGLGLPDARGGRRGQRVALPAAPRGARFADDAGAEIAARDNPFVSAWESPLSTFSPEVEAASYAETRKFIAAGRLPPRESVRIEELVNFFPYRYAPPKDNSPFAAELLVTEAPWAPAHRLVRIALKGRESNEAPHAVNAAHRRAAANIVFVIDVSTSMKTRNKLPVVQEAIRRLATRLRPDDRVAIVTYSGSAGLVLPSIPASRTREIGQAVEALIPDGGTSELTGLPLAYNVARANFVPNGLNRVILCTDGDFSVGNLGVGSQAELLRLVTNRAQFGVSLSVIALGMGEERNALIPTLAVRGKGHFGYVETRAHAEKLLAMEVETSLTTIAQDVKIQVEFNPMKVARYRLLGYENRPLRREDFNDDRVDGAAIGAGHTLTALYEIVPHGIAPKEKEAWAALEDLRYGHIRPVQATDGSAGDFDPLSNELLTVKVRYKYPDGLISRSLEFPLVDRGLKFSDASSDYRFAVAVASFGMILRRSPYRGGATVGDVLAWAGAAVESEDDAGADRREFIELARQAQRLLP